MSSQKERSPTPETQSPESAEPFEYSLLTGHATSNGTFKTSEQLRMEYLHLTDDLIRKITEGVEIKNRTTGEYELKKPDTVIFLDKSARPVSWLMKEMWSEFATDTDGTVQKRPDIRYLNIDREQWVNTVDPNGIGRMDIDKVDQTIIRSLRSIFVPTHHKSEGLVEGIDTAPAELDGKTIMVIDEVYSSGRTLKIAEKMIQRAFPTATVFGDYWMKGVTTKNRGLAVGNADLPVWYKDKEEYGRGVGNRLRDPSDSSSTNTTQQLGRWFLSRRLPETDVAGNRLRQELRQLARDPNVLRRPSREREDYEQRVERLNGIPFALAQQAIIEVAKRKS